jgi:phosphopantothenoylcysteine synthetase/decarboxylase
MACRTVGMGRMAEPAEIVQALVARLKSAPPKGRVPRDV